ncbi:lactate dehydrogenase [Helicobacter sp. 13S00482-2]|uniref:FAD-binding and (Fe-S)-binding domain-containing protein n=1 Tax=Helicobacter sp. 13S00482-2 TaxID=1476200 RepID=UPI000BA753FC|nr:FAD-binding and (Fe-S)-binding domain-containing protein [Helicobacter sp. 13S00482-2]PAF54244.1 lactate dehydrogenase [Helicobacter sp. 13S00482-2]
MQDYESFKQEIKKNLKSRVYEDYLRRFAYGIDASCYRYIPKLVIKAYNEDEIIKIYALSQKYTIPITFRAAGTSLSGQACSNEVLVITTHNWENIEVKEDGNLIKLSCGVIGSQANEALKPYGKKIGPDPATISSAMIGGILSNNSSGMCCGVKQNSYNTIRSIRVILADGTLLDTSDAKSVENFKQTHQKMIEEILELRKEILADEELKAIILKKYKIKNTTGYSINSLVDFSDVIEIIKHLFIGSEGTLGFISGCEYECVEDYPYKACALLFYENIQIAAKAVNIFADLQSLIQSAEIMDYASLKSVQNFKGIPDIIHQIQNHNACILIQTQASDKQILQNNLDSISKAISYIPTVLPPLISDDEKIYSSWWKTRKALLPIAASSRRKGSCVITEDICFQINLLGTGIKMIEKLFEKYGFKDNGIIFGHALSGNIHFIITPILSNKDEFENFESLIKEMSQNIVDLKGSIKAEHGTGRMIAPFVELEWGKKAYEINKKIKHIFDPNNLINPDVIISNNPNIHLKNLKPSTEIEEYLDACMECGFCEKICPSKNLTLTPRGRIGVYREIKRLELSVQSGNTKDIPILKELKKDFDYFVDKTCAACKMCSSLCPIEIPTEKIALENRAKKSEGMKEKIAHKILHHMKVSTSILGFGLKGSEFTSNILGENNLIKLNSSIRNFSTMIPKISKNLPTQNTYKLKNKFFGNTDVIYFTTCINRTFAPSKNMPDQRSIQEVFESLCAKTKTNIIYPEKIDSMCCGKAFMDYKKLSEENINKNYLYLDKLSKSGKIPIVMDHTACSNHLIENLKSKNLIIYDLNVYIYEFLLPVLKITPINENIGLYTMCAGKKMSQEDKMHTLAKKCTKGKIYIHKNTGCCGFAGDKGFFTPELNQSALEGFSKYYKDKKIKRGFGSSSTCEIGLSDKTGFGWQHIAYLVDECSRGEI